MNEPVAEIGPDHSERQSSFRIGAQPRTIVPRHDATFPRVPCRATSGKEGQSLGDRKSGYPGECPTRQGSVASCTVSGAIPGLPKVPTTVPGGYREITLG